MPGLIATIKAGLSVPLFLPFTHPNIDIVVVFLFDGKNNADVLERVERFIFILESYDLKKMCNKIIGDKRE